MTEQTQSQHPWHGHVRPREDGVKARCGGPAMCDKCKLEQTLYGEKKTDEEKILYWMSRAKEAEQMVVGLTQRLQAEAGKQIEDTEAWESLRQRAACYDWLRAGVKYRQGQMVPDIGYRVIDKSALQTALSFTRWVTQEEMDRLILAEIAKEQGQDGDVKA